MGSMWGRCRVDAGSMWGRCGVDVGSMWDRCRVARRSMYLKMEKYRINEEVEVKEGNKKH